MLLVIFVVNKRHHTRQHRTNQVSQVMPQLPTNPGHREEETHNIDSHTASRTRIK